ncbi:hypothetical protein JI747_003425 [Chryseobacterium sp. RG1]|uniref:Polymer-forming protein n=1 Tax=Chryseobacterium tagetis TaxID=2801334 RepID=A0ABS7ZWW0_9FLAO|nr:hypothetical protein [Chryseobacterium tagetis]MCA6066214.1 hypothetical protein [Chryseobacterium tagetis]
MRLKNIISVFLYFICFYAYSQVGIQTTKPNHPLHIDAASNNNNQDPSTAVQKADDVVITSNGSLGIGEVAPDRKLVVKGSLKITDGTEGAGKILMSNANGVASWNGNVNIQGNYAQWELRQTAGMNFPASDTITLGSTDPSQATLSSTVKIDNGIGITTNSYGVHVPKGKYVAVLNGDVQGREYCYLLVNLDGKEVYRIAYAEYLSGVFFFLEVPNATGGDITLRWVNRPLSGITYYQVPTNRTYFYTLDFNLLGNLLF